MGYGPDVPQGRAEHAHFLPEHLSDAAEILNFDSVREAR